MTGERLVPWLAVGALAALLCGCAGTEPSAGTGRRQPRFVVELAGRARAVEAGPTTVLPRGPGAEARMGDLVLENTAVQFVVSADDHGTTVPMKGNVIDAVVHAGEDQMRLLAPLAGAGQGVRPLYESVAIEQPGGEGLPARVVSTGYLPGLPDVKVRTTYTLEPGAWSLEIATSLRNEGAAAVRGCVMGDLLYHGRTLRFAPGPAGSGADGASRSQWVSFFRDGLSWGIITTPLGSMEGRHAAGLSRLLYARADLPPGSERTYRRFLAACIGGPEAVWCEVEGAHPVTTGRLVVQVTEGDSKAPVSGARVQVKPDDVRSPFMLAPDPEGRAAVELRPGAYRLTAWAPGRTPWGPVTASVAAGHTVRHNVRLSARAEAAVSVTSEIDGVSAPAHARLVSVLAGAPTSPFPPVGVFAEPGEHGAALTGSGGPAVLPLAPNDSAPERCYILATCGPLFSVAGAMLAAEAGQRAEAALTLERMMHPGDYATVDFRRYTAASPDCALSCREVAQAGGCEGLDAVLAVDPTVPTHMPVFAEGECRVLPALRMEADATGSFSVFPAPPSHGIPQRVPGQPGLTLAALRQAFPDALITVYEPTDPRRGYFAAAGFDLDLRARAPADLNTSFDAIEILGGADVPGARRLLAYWFELLNAGLRVVAVGGSGTQAYHGLDTGGARTFVRRERRGPDGRLVGLAEAILRLREHPDAFVTNGPFIEAAVDGQPIGSVIVPGGPTVEMSLRVLAPIRFDVARVTVYRNGLVAEEFECGEAKAVERFARSLSLDASSDCWYVIEVTGTKPMAPLYGSPNAAPVPFAVTNPFWVDADGDGAVRPEIAH